MASRSDIKAVRCGNCNYDFSYQPGTDLGQEIREAHCPRCGSKTKNYEMGPLDFVSRVALTVGWKQAEELWQFHPGWFALLVAIILISPFVGFALGDVGGVIVGLLLGIVGAVVGAYAITKVVRIRRGGGD